jgi:hypothetical protein
MARCVRATTRRMPCRALAQRLRGEAPSVFTQTNRELEVQPTAFTFRRLKIQWKHLALSLGYASIKGSHDDGHVNGALETNKSKLNTKTVLLHEEQTVSIIKPADPSGSTVWAAGLRPLACWDYGFESRRGHGCLSVVSDVCCQVEVFASGRSLIQRSATDCGASKCDREASTMRRPWPTRGRLRHERKRNM